MPSNEQLSQPTTAVATQQTNTFKFQFAAQASARHLACNNVENILQSEKHKVLLGQSMSRSTVSQYRDTGYTNDHPTNF